MPQPPYLVDVLQIEPGSGDTLTIDRDPADGAMRFIDAVLTSGVLLPELVGLRNVDGVFVVGRAGDGAPYTTIQAALDEVPLTSNASAPSLILLLPGEYTENITILRDGVYIASLGGVRIVNSGANDTVTIAASIASTPLSTLLRGIEIENVTTGQACVRIVGADQFASGTVTVNTAPLAVGDVVTINGVPLTGVTGTRTSGANDFSVAGGTTDALAGEIAAALNDVANSFSTLVEASVVGSVITLTAVTAGSGGNSITLTVTTVPVGGLAVSGATLTGGGAAGTVLGSGGIVIEDCTLKASAVGTFQIRADTSNYIDVRGGTFRGSASTSETNIANCARFTLSGVDWVNDLNLTYNTGTDQPSDTSSAYEVTSCGRINDSLVSLTGAGSLVYGSCPQMGALTMGGDRTLDVRHSTLGALTLSDTVAATLRSSARASVALGGGTPTLAESKSLGSQVFTASVLETVTFTIPQPDTSYTVLLESPTTTETLAVTTKTAASFDIAASAAVTGTVGFTVVRDL
jgi:hypothetical protein